MGLLRHPRLVVGHHRRRRRIDAGHLPELRHNSLPPLEGMPAAERGRRPEPHLRRQRQQLRHQPGLRRMHRRDDEARRVLEDHQRIRADAGEPLLRQPLRPVRHPGHHPRHARGQQRLPRRHLPGRQPRAHGHANRPRSRVPGRRQATGRPGRELPARRPLPDHQPLRVRRQLRHHHNRRNAARQRRHRQDHARLRYPKLSCASSTSWRPSSRSATTGSRRCPGRPGPTGSSSTAPRRPAWTTAPQRCRWSGGKLPGSASPTPAAASTTRCRGPGSPGGSTTTTRTPTATTRRTAPSSARSRKYRR